MQKVGIKKIALDVGVSTATVSRVLNNTRNVREDIQRRVLSSAKRLNYQPDDIARSLRLQKTRTIGILIPHITNTVFTDAVCGVEDVALNSGYSVLICNYSEDPERERRYIQLMQSRRVEGVIISPAAGPWERFASLMEEGVPIVCMHRRLADLNVDAVVVDNVKGARIVVKHLLARGYRRIAILAGPNTLSPVVERLEGYKKALLENGLPVYDNYIKFTDYNEIDGYRAAAELLDAPKPPDAIFVVLNVLMLGVLKAVQERALRIPREIALVGVDDMQWAAVVTPPLTMMSQPIYDVGAKAAEIILKKIKGETQDGTQLITLSPTLVVRGST